LFGGTGQGEVGEGILGRGSDETGEIKVTLVALMPNRGEKHPIVAL
jgi:hypothetical protein